MSGNGEAAAAPARRPGTVASVERAGQILHMFLDGRRTLAVSEVAQRLGVANSTAHRLLRALCRSGVLQQSPASKRYELSLLVYKLGTLAVTHSELYRRAFVPLEQLHRATAEGCHLSVPDFPQIVYFEHRDTDRTMHFIARMGGRAPANCTSTGKVLLAHAADGVIDEVLATGLVRLTQHSITDRVRMLEELAEVRERGYARSSDEMELGVTSIAAPVRDRGGTVVAALGIAGPTERMVRLPSARAVDALLACSAEITSRLSSLPQGGIPV